MIVARESVELATEGLAVAQKHAETVGALVASGSATRRAELQAAMAVARAERELAGAAARKTWAEAAFAALVEVGPDVVLELPASRDLGFLDVDAALAAARSRRPELRAARAQEDAARATGQRERRDLARRPRGASGLPRGSGPGGVAGGLRPPAP